MGRTWISEGEMKEVMVMTEPARRKRPLDFSVMG